MCVLTQKEQDFFEEIKGEKDGVPFYVAHTMIIPSNDLAEENHKIISQLISKGLLKIVTIEGIDYLQTSEASSESEANNNCLFEQNGCNIIGSPHSPAGMKSLGKEFHENTDTLYLFLGTTSYETFQDILKVRTAKGYKTVFIYPSYKTISNEKKQHYTQKKVGKLYNTITEVFSRTDALCFSFWRHSTISKPPEPSITFPFRK